MKDIKHIRQDFHLIIWIMSQGWDLGVMCVCVCVWGGGGGGGGVGGSTFFSEIQPELICELLT